MDTTGLGKRGDVDSSTETGDSQVGGGPRAESVDARMETVDAQVVRGTCASEGAMSGLGASIWDNEGGIGDRGQ